MKITSIVFASILAFASAGCFAEGEEASTAPAEANNGFTCPSKDFKVFLQSFSESTEIQEAFTHIPDVNNDESTFPMIFNAEKRKKENMNLKIVELKAKTAKVIFDKDETDYKVAFYFERNAKCWELVKVEDLSG